MASTRQEIYDGRGARIGWIETDERGNKRVYSMTKGVVGYYYTEVCQVFTGN